MIEGRMNGVAEAHHAQSVFGGFAYSSAAPYPTFVKDAQHYGRHLPHDIKSTSSYHSPYVADYQTPINLVQKDLPTHTNGCVAYRNVAPLPSPFPIYPFTTTSLIGGPFTAHQQAPYTPLRTSYTTTAAAPMVIQTSRPSPESSLVDVKTSSAVAAVNGENHDFKKPDENNSRYYKKRKRPGHAPTSAAPVEPSAPISIAAAATPMAPPPPSTIGRLSQQPSTQSQSHKSLLQPTLNENAVLSKMDAFCKDSIIYFGPEKAKTYVSLDEFGLLRNRGELIPIEDVTVKDFQTVTKNGENELRAVTVKSLSENLESGKVLYELVLPDQEKLGVLELEAERPLFTFDRGWTSYLPDRTRERCKGLNCSKINVGDVVLLMSPKITKRASAAVSTAQRNRFQKTTTVAAAAAATTTTTTATTTDLNHTRTSDSYHEFTNNCGSNNNNNNNNGVSIAAAAATVAAANRNALRRQFNENDSNNNNESAASMVKRKRCAEEVRNATVKTKPFNENDSSNDDNAATAKLKRSTEEANKRRYSDSYLEKKF